MDERTKGVSNRESDKTSYSFLFWGQNYHATLFKSKKTPILQIWGLDGKIYTLVSTYSYIQLQMKKILGAAVVLAAIGVAGYLYISTPIPVPTTDVQTVTDTLKPLSDKTTVYRISKEGSLAQYEIDETLRGNPKHVVGTTTQIAGDIAFTGSQIDFGEMRIDARTFISDSDKRDNALNKFILNTEKEGNEYIIFRPISTDFSGSATETGEMAMNVKGDLIISGVLQLAEFSVTMKFEGDTLVGTAKTTIKRSDYGIKIPELEFIADVKDEIDLTVRVVANKVVAVQ